MKPPAEYAAFNKVVKAVLAVSKEEIQRREVEYQEQAAQNPKRRGPKRGSKRKPKSASSPVPADEPKA